MSDLNVVAVLKAKPGTEGAIRDALASLIEPTRAEPGNVSYDLYESAAESGTFITIEKWRSQEDMNAHMQTPHIAAALGAAAGHLDEAPAIHPLVPVEG
jgi:quinol monooxygenase YgiN